MMFTINYRGAVITEYDGGRCSVWIAYSLFGEYATMRAAKRAASMENRRYLAERAAVHHKSILAIWAPK